MQSSARQISEQIRQSKNVLIIPHQRPDLDAIGSAGTLAEWLHTEKINHSIFCATPAAERLQILPHVFRLQWDTAIWREQSFDSVIVVDSSDLDYAGVSKTLAALPNRPQIINIDHHATNIFFGDLNMVRPYACSTTQILHDFLNATGVSINPTMATSLLAGIVGDTDNFTNSATSQESLRIASELMRAGGNMALVQRAHRSHASIENLKIWGIILSRFQKHESLDIVYSYLETTDLAVYNVEESTIEGVANFLNSINDGRAGLILRELPNGRVKGSFRTTRHDVDVASFAQKFGGGGHKKAAGFTVDGPIEKALATVFSTLSNDINLPK